MKYIIELEDTPFSKKDGDFLYRAKGFNSLVFDLNGLNKLEKYDKAKIQHKNYEQGKTYGYQQGYEAGFTEGRMDAEGYERGLIEAWEVARHMVNNLADDHFVDGEMVDIFGCESCSSAFLQNTAAEALEKIKAYERRKYDEIRVGDEVIAALTDEKGTAVVTQVNSKKDIRYIYANGDTGWDVFYELKKTGRHFTEVEKLLEAMKE